MRSATKKAVEYERPAESLGVSHVLRVGDKTSKTAVRDRLRVYPEGRYALASDGRFAIPGLDVVVLASHPELTGGQQNEMLAHGERVAPARNACASRSALIRGSRRNAARASGVVVLGTVNVSHFRRTK